MVKATKDNRPFSSGVFDLEEFNIYTKVIDLPLDGMGHRTKRIKRYIE